MYIPTKPIDPRRAYDRREQQVRHTAIVERYEARRRHQEARAPRKAPRTATSTPRPNGDISRPLWFLDDRRP